MSMDEAPAEGVADAGPEEIGDAGSEAVEQTDDGGEPPRQFVEVDDPDNRYVRVKVDGQDEEIPFAEALRGYSREADYTRKAQAVAEQRKEAEFGLNLQRALQANPELTLRVLAEQYGYTVPPTGQQAEPEDDFAEYTDPLERALMQEKRAREDLERRISQREADEQLERAVNGLRQQFNLNDDDVQEVVGIAYRGGFGIEALPMIYKTMAYDRIAARVQAQRADEERRAAETARRTAAKSSAGQVVASGSRGAGGLTGQVDAGGRMTLREAIEAAFEEAERG